MDSHGNIRYLADGEEPRPDEIRLPHLRDRFTEIETALMREVEAQLVRAPGMPIEAPSQTRELEARKNFDLVPLDGMSQRTRDRQERRRKHGGLSRFAQTIRSVRPR